MSTDKDKPFDKGFSLEEVLDPQDRDQNGDEDSLLDRLPYDYHTEILDTQTHWIYEKLKNGKIGKKKRKFYSSLFGASGIKFWQPKIKDLLTCEAKRWKAKQYQKKQYDKIVGVFDITLKSTPFKCIKLTKEYPGFGWVEFPRNTGGISWNWVNGGRHPHQDDSKFPLKQDIGDLWFHYEQRSRIIQQRAGYFHTLFQKALEDKFANYFYRNHRLTDQKAKLVLNGREYIIGFENGRQFGVVAYPEDTITFVLTPENQHQEFFGKELVGMNPVEEIEEYDDLMSHYHDEYEYEDEDEYEMRTISHEDEDDPSPQDYWNNPNDY